MLADTAHRATFVVSHTPFTANSSMQDFHQRRNHLLSILQDIAQRNLVRNWPIRAGDVQISSSKNDYATD
ncbi:hypothetical protein TrVFT333_006530 [Trichoderma virens FT-333]|nr:hypothetical protein TrVFT333_006530 [Trichoderma virens FT-333]